MGTQPHAKRRLTRLASRAVTARVLNRGPTNKTNQNVTEELVVSGVELGLYAERMPFGKKAPAVATWSAHDLNVDGVSCDIRERKSRGNAAGWAISVGRGKGTAVYPFDHSIAIGAFPDGFPCEDVWKARVRADSRFVACKEATEARCVPNPNSCQGQREDQLLV